MKFTLMILFSMILIANQNLVCAQPATRLNFNFIRDPFFGAPCYKWSFEGDFFTHVTSPGGTKLSGFGEAEFATFEEFQLDIVGSWIVTSDISTAESTFDLSSFAESDFVEIELVSPIDGQQFLNGDSVQIEAEPETTSFSLFTPNGASSELLGGGAFTIFLDDRVDQIAVQTYAIKSEFRTDVISNIAGDIRVLPICDETRVSSTSDRATLVFSRTKSFLGDVNRDESIDLLDVAPFVDLLTAGLFQFEADVNGDGMVDLLDVEPFVDLFS